MALFAATFPLGMTQLQHSPTSAFIPLCVLIHGRTVSGAPAWPHAQPWMFKVYLLQHGLFPQNLRCPELFLLQHGFILASQSLWRYSFSGWT